MKKLKKTTLLAVILTVGLVGCSSSTPQQLVNAQDECKERGGIRLLEHHFPFNCVHVNCMDGHRKLVKKTAD